MKVLYILNSITDFKSGCHFFRIFLPSLFMTKNGIEVNYVTHNYDKAKIDGMIKWADVVVFQRAYSSNEDIKNIIKICKLYKKNIAYDLDDDIWNIVDENPAICSAKHMDKSAKILLKNADVVTTTTETLKKALLNFNKNVEIVENAIDPMIYKDYGKSNESLPIVVYAGSASHWKDFMTILPTMQKIKEEIPFVFVMIGFTQSPLDSAMYEYKKLQTFGVKDKNTKYQKAALECYEYLKKMNVIHFPFYTPELFPTVLAKQINGDIGICPLEDVVFNNSKSCLKFYEYGACGMATIAPRILPYSDEVDYTYENLNDFEIKFKKLLKDKELRKEVAQRQMKWVLENRDINKIVNKWIKIYERKN